MTVVMLLVAGCSESEPEPPPPPPGVLHVQPFGNASDRYDGVTNPLRTLGRALELARADDSIHRIELAEGAYVVGLDGEDFPYLVPPNVAIVGPTDGVANLNGATPLSGLVLANSELRNVTLTNFGVAVTSTGFDHLENVVIRQSGVGVDAQSTSRLSATAINIATGDGSCPVGVRTAGAAQIALLGLETAGVGHAVKLDGRSDARITMSYLHGDPRCASALIAANTSGTIELANSELSGGTTGIELPLSGEPTTLHVSEVTIASMTGAGITGGRAEVAMSGGKLTGNGTGVLAQGGVWTLSRVKIDGNAGGVNAAAPLTRLFVGGGQITDNTGYGVLVNGADIELSVVQLDNPAGVGAIVTQGSTLSAAGCQWRAGVQGADVAGRYPEGVITGPLTGPAGDNFALGFDASIAMR